MVVGLCSGCGRAGRRVRVRAVIRQGIRGQVRPSRSGSAFRSGGDKDPRIFHLREVGGIGGHIDRRGRAADITDGCLQGHRVGDQIAPGGLRLDNSVCVLVVCRITLERDGDAVSHGQQERTGQKLQRVGLGLADGRPGRNSVRAGGRDLVCHLRAARLDVTGRVLDLVGDVVVEGKAARRRRHQRPGRSAVGARR